MCSNSQSRSITNQKKYFLISRQISYAILNCPKKYIYGYSKNKPCICYFVSRSYIIKLLFLQKFPKKCRLRRGYAVLKKFPKKETKRVNDIRNEMNMQRQMTFVIAFLMSATPRLRRHKKFVRFIFVVFSYSFLFF